MRLQGREREGEGKRGHSRMGEGGGRDGVVIFEDLPLLYKKRI